MSVLCRRLSSHGGKKNAVLTPALTSTSRQMGTTTVIRKKERVVILGSGWAGYNLCRLLDPSKFQVVCVSPSNHFLFTPLLPQTAVGTLEFRAIQEPIRTIKGIEYHQAKVQDIHLDKKRIVCRDIFKLHNFETNYDRLIVATGSKTNTFGIKGVAEREGKEIFFLKHLYHARQIRSRILECFERADIPGIDDAEKSRLLNFIIVGGGPTSCEFCAELHDFVQEDVARWYPDLKQFIQIHLIEASDDLLGTFDKTLRDYTKRLFKKRQIDVQTGVQVSEVKFIEDIFQSKSDSMSTTSSTTNYLENESKTRHHSTIAVLSKDGATSEMSFGMMVWSAGLGPVKLVSGLDNRLRTSQGRIAVNDFLQVQAVEEHDGLVDSVWAIGDCAIGSTGLPPIATVAQQQAKYLARTFNSAATTPEVPFNFIGMGSMVQLGYGEGAVDTTHILAKDMIVRGQDWMHPKVKGFLAWIMWRSAYWGKQTSLRNKILIPMHWFQSFMFGRDISRF